MLSATPPRAPVTTNRCSFCGFDVKLDAALPEGETPCPGCGQCLRYFHQPDGLHVFRPDVLARSVPIIADKLEVPKEAITPVVTFADLGADSLDAVEVTMELESAFNVSFDIEDGESIRTVGDALRAVERCLATKKE